MISRDTQSGHVSQLIICLRYLTNLIHEQKQISAEEGSLRDTLLC